MSPTSALSSGSRRLGLRLPPGPLGPRLLIPACPFARAGRQLRDPEQNENRGALVGNAGKAFLLPSLSLLPTPMVLLVCPLRSAPSGTGTLAGGRCAQPPGASPQPLCGPYTHPASQPGLPRDQGAAVSGGGWEAGGHRDGGRWLEAGGPGASALAPTRPPSPNAFAGKTQLTDRIVRTPVGALPRPGAPPQCCLDPLPYSDACLSTPHPSSGAQSPGLCVSRLAAGHVPQPQAPAYSSPGSAQSQWPGAARRPAVSSTAQPCPW